MALAAYEIGVIDEIVEPLVLVRQAGDRCWKWFSAYSRGFMLAPGDFVLAQTSVLKAG